MSRATPEVTKARFGNAPSRLCPQAERAGGGRPRTSRNPRGATTPGGQKPLTGIKGFDSPTGHEPAAHPPRGRKRAHFGAFACDNEGVTSCQIL